MKKLILLGLTVISSFAISFNECIVSNANDYGTTFEYRGKTISTLYSNVRNVYEFEGKYYMSFMMIEKNL